MYKYHSADISHTFSHSLTHKHVRTHAHTHSERQLYKALVTVAAVPMVGLQMRAKAGGRRSKFSRANNACQRGPSWAFFEAGEMLLRSQREGSRTLPETGENRDVYTTKAQVAIVICVFFLTSYHDCVCMPAVLWCIFLFSVKRE